MNQQAMTTSSLKKFGTKLPGLNARNCTSNQDTQPNEKGTENLIKKKEKAQGWQREAKMAAVGRARLKTESLINSQKSRALYGEAGEKDIERRQGGQANIW